MSELDLYGVLAVWNLAVFGLGLSIWGMKRWTS